mgnify:CR=1 FL=1
MRLVEMSKKELKRIALYCIKRRDKGIEANLFRMMVITEFCRQNGIEL